LAASDQV
jgi:hypothetical protein